MVCVPYRAMFPVRPREGEGVVRAVRPNQRKQSGATLPEYCCRLLIAPLVTSVFMCGVISKHVLTGLILNQQRRPHSHTPHAEAASSLFASHTHTDGSTTRIRPFAVK